MSITTSIRITFRRPLVNPLPLLENLSACGWQLTLESQTAISYFTVGPRGDDDYSWEYLDSWAEVVAILQSRVADQQSVGLRLYTGESEVDFIFWKGYSDFTALVNGVMKQNIPESRVTDFSWYLRQIMPALNEQAPEIAVIECSDY